MSYGRKRALEIATTLAMEPELMLLDEPTQGMGHEDVDRVTALIKKVSSGRTILMVEHNMNVIAGISDTITVLQRGEVLAEGTLRRSIEESARDASLYGQRRCCARRSARMSTTIAERESVEVQRRRRRANPRWRSRACRRGTANPTSCMASI